MKYNTTYAKYNTTYMKQNTTFDRGTGIGKQRGLVSAKRKR